MNVFRALSRKIRQFSVVECELQQLVANIFVYISTVENTNT